MVMEVNPSQPEKQSPPKLVTELGILLFLHPTTNSLVEVRIIALQLSLESYTGLAASTTIRSRPLQPSKHQSPKLVTELGMVMEVNLLQYEKHFSPKLITELGMVMEVKLLQYQKQAYPKLVTESGMVMKVKLSQR